MCTRTHVALQCTYTDAAKTFLDFIEKGGKCENTHLVIEHDTRQCSRSQHVRQGILWFACVLMYYP